MFFNKIVHIVYMLNNFLSCIISKYEMCVNVFYLNYLVYFTNLYV